MSNDKKKTTMTNNTIKSVKNGMTGIGQLKPKTIVKATKKKSNKG